MSFKGLPSLGIGGTMGCLMTYFFKPSVPQTDADTQAFLDAAGITDETITSALDDAVIALKANALWSKMRAIYPMVGGTADTCKYNLKDPRDLDAAYRLTYTGTVDFASTGITPQWGVTPKVLNYADTKFPSNGLAQNDGHISVFVRTYTGSGGVRLQMGFRGGGGDNLTVGNIPGLAAFGGIYGQFGFGGTYGTGLYLTSRTGATTQALYLNGSLLTADTTSSGTPTAGSTIWLGDTASDTLGGCGDEISFATIGSGLDSTEVATLNTIVQAFQTALGR
jgi:hypothetical protein